MLRGYRSNLDHVNPKSPRRQQTRIDGGKFDVADITQESIDNVMLEVGKLEKEVGSRLEMVARVKNKLDQEANGNHDDSIAEVTAIGINYQHNTPNNDDAIIADESILNLNSEYDNVENDDTKETIDGTTENDLVDSTEKCNGKTTTSTEKEVIPESVQETNIKTEYEQKAMDYATAQVTKDGNNCNTKPLIHVEGDVKLENSTETTEEGVLEHQEAMDPSDDVNNLTQDDKHDNNTKEKNSEEESWRDMIVNGEAFTQFSLFDILLLFFTLLHKIIDTD